MIRQISVTRLTHDCREMIEDDVAAEYPLTLYLNGEEWITLLCSPDALEFLVYGFLKSEGLIRSVAEVGALTLDREKGQGWITLESLNPMALQLQGKRAQTSGCAKGITFYNALDALSLAANTSDLRVRFTDLAGLMAAFNGASPVFKATGGVHSCAVCSSDALLLLQEDIGRHNALDKLIGEAMTTGLSLKDKVLLTSGRISSEILLKAARAGLPIVVSRSAPTDLAVREAQKLGITLAGFLRGSRCNVYAWPERIICEGDAGII